MVLAPTQFVDTYATKYTDEQCDDGNLTPGDGCEPDCTLT
ncbi:MAG: hypothetical protein ABIK09_03165 [Pseudomonadota bacterium]